MAAICPKGASLMAERKSVMSLTLRIILIVCSILSFALCISKVKQSKMQVTDSVVWMVGTVILILMSVFSNVVDWIAVKLGFIAPVNFVFLIIIAFLLIQGFLLDSRVSILSNKVKDLNHYIALMEKKQNDKEQIGK